MGFKFCGHNIFLHNSYRKWLFCVYLNLWIWPTTKTMKIGTPWKLNLSQYQFSARYCKLVIIPDVPIYAVVPFNDEITYWQIFTMVSYFLHWTLLKFFSSFPDEQSQQKVRHLSRITGVVINTSNEVKCPLLWEFWIYNFSQRI